MRVFGMICVVCVFRIEKGFKWMLGVIDVNVNLVIEMLNVIFDFVEIGVVVI